MFSGAPRCMMSLPHGRWSSLDKVISESIAYMEAHLKAEISPAELAERAGYSLWHFTRLFAGATGQSPAQYMLRRRLDHALAEIAAGQHAIDVVLAYGFETYSGFYRAFVKLYGCSPRKYLRIYGGHTLQQTEVTMKQYTKRELQRVLAHWGMEKQDIGPVPVMYDGRPDDSAWQVGSEHRLRTGTGCLRDLRVTKALAAHGFTADVPVPTLDGKDYLEDKAVFLLSQVIPGTPLHVPDCYGPNSPARALGAGIARLHAALRDIAAELSYDRGDLSGTLLGWALPATRKQDQQWAMGLGEAFFAEVQAQFEALYPALPRQLIHRNLCPSYTLLRDGQVAGFTQFDMLVEEARLFDLCYAATSILSETAEEALYPAWLDVLRDLLRGYHSVSPLTSEERRAVFVMLCGIQMICVACFADHEPYRELSRRNRAMLRFIAEHRERIGRIAAEI